jgi:uncharacterized protein
MTRFVGRKRELEELNRILSQSGAQFILVYGRRRVGKTTLRSIGPSNLADRTFIG